MQYSDKEIFFKLWFVSIMNAGYANLSRLSSVGVFDFSASDAAIAARGESGRLQVKSCHAADDFHERRKG